MNIIWSGKLIAINSFANYIVICFHHKCHHYSDSGHDLCNHGHNNDKIIDNNHDDQNKYNISYGKLLCSSQLFYLTDIIFILLCHHYSYHGNDQTDESLEYHNNYNDQLIFGVSNVKFIWVSKFIAINLIRLFSLRWSNILLEIGNNKTISKNYLHMNKIW